MHTEADSQQAFQQVAQKMFTFLQTYAQRHSYALVQERGPDTAPAIWYAAKGLDITADLTKAFDEQGPSATHGPSPASGSSLPSAPSAH